jgi:hypothetical protein
LVIYVLSELPERWDVYRLAEEMSNFVAQTASEEDALALAVERAKSEPEGARIVRVELSGNSRVVGDIAPGGEAGAAATPAIS